MMRGALDAAQAALKLTSKDDAVRAEAARALFKEPDESRLPMVEKALAAETNRDQGAARTGACRQPAHEHRQGQAPGRRQGPGASRSPDTKLLLNQRLADETESDVKAAIVASIREHRRLAGLGRPHQRDFQRHQPGLGAAARRSRPGNHLWRDGRHQHGARRANDGRRLLHLGHAGPLPGAISRVASTGTCWRTIPVAFLALGAGRRALERLVIRFLYGRPLGRRLLATSGHLVDAAATGALDLRRPERRRREPVLDERRPDQVLSNASRCPGTASSVIGLARAWCCSRWAG